MEVGSLGVQAHLHTTQDSGCSFPALQNLSASFCAPGRKEEERKGARQLLLGGFGSLLGKERPQKDFLLQGITTNGVIHSAWPPACLEVSVTRVPASLVEEGKGAGGWAWLSSDL